MYNFAGEWERVALVFGYGDDYAACEDIRRGLEDQFVRDYRCTVVNQQQAYVAGTSSPRPGKPGTRENRGHTPFFGRLPARFQGRPRSSPQTRALSRNRSVKRVFRVHGERRLSPTGERNQR
jgi:hypothetical protein